MSLSLTKTQLSTLLALILSCASLSAHGASCSAQSPAHTIAFVELYTSEGCSSCPPADRWLGELSQRYAAEQLIALSLHVDYWDYIGWPDRFAQTQFTERQNQLSALLGSRTIYTPEVFASMRELRGWSNKTVFDTYIQTTNHQAARANIKLTMHSADNHAFNVETQFSLTPAAGADPIKNAQAIVIVYEKALSSEVRAGENRGTKLSHDNVVRYWSAPISINAQTGRAEWKQSIKLPADWQRNKLGLAAFVQDSKAGEVLQALSLPSCI